MNLLFNIIVGIFAVIGLATVSIVAYGIYKEERKQKRKQKEIERQLEILGKLNDDIREGLQEVFKQQGQENEDN